MNIPEWVAVLIGVVVGWLIAIVQMIIWGRP